MLIVRQIEAVIPHVKLYKIHGIVDQYFDLKAHMTPERTKNLVGHLSIEGVSETHIEKITDILLRSEAILADADTKLPQFVRDWKEAYVAANGTAAPEVTLYSSMGGWYMVQGSKKRKKDFIEMTGRLRARVSA